MAGVPSIRNDERVDLPQTPVGIGGDAQRAAAAGVRADLRAARLRPAVWSWRIVVLLVGAPVALLGMSAGLLMDKQDRNGDPASLAALDHRIEQRIIECIRRSDEPLPAVARYELDSIADDAVACAGECPALACAQHAAEPLVHQAPAGFSRVVELDFATDRLIARERVLADLRGALVGTGIVLTVAADERSYRLSCDNGPDVVIVPASYRADVDVAKLRGQLRALLGHPRMQCAR